jgi:hypothetical protein
MISDDGLLTIPLSLTTEHLGHAIESMRKSKVAADSAPTGWNLQLVHRCAISAILHGFCALESTVNLFGHEIFFRPESNQYIPTDSTDFLLRRFLTDWNRASVLEKISVVLKYAYDTHMPENLACRLRELSTLRNWLVHGFTYTRTLLLQPDGEEENTYVELDREDNVDWSQKFPNTKFKPLDQLDYEDARVGLAIVLEALRLLIESTQQVLLVMTCEYPGEYWHLTKDSFDIDGMLRYEVGKTWPQDVSLETDKRHRVDHDVIVPQGEPADL